MNYGLDLKREQQHSSPDDWIFGGFSTPCIASIPETERFKYLPSGEVQRGLEDMMDCATRGPINILKTKFNWLYRNNKITPENKAWLEKNGYVRNGNVEFSNAFIAILSGTTREGNSLKAPLQAIENNGLVPNSRLPLLSTMTFDEYHNPLRITSVLQFLGQEFKKRFPINYEKVYEIHYNELYEGDMIVEAGYAWSIPVNGEYPNIGADPNHVWMGICRPLHTIFDNYIDSVDGDFIKKLAPDYDMLDYGYRVFISAENKVINSFTKQSLWSKILAWFTKFYKL
jgi:hypothetical protein